MTSAIIQKLLRRASCQASRQADAGRHDSTRLDTTRQVSAPLPAGAAPQREDGAGAGAVAAADKQATQQN